MLAPKQNVDYRNLSGQPTPEDFFLLSRIRGAVSVGQVVSLSGLGKEKTLEGLERLIELGLVEVQGGAGGELMGRGKATVGPPIAKPQPPNPTKPKSQPEKISSPAPTVGRTPSKPSAAPTATKPRDTPREVHSSFVPVITEGNDDDLFESDSPAHLSKIRASVGVDHRAADDELFGGTSQEVEDSSDQLGGDDDLFSGRAAASPQEPEQPVESDDDLFGGRPSSAVEAAAPVKSHVAAQAKSVSTKVSLFEESEASPQVSEPDFGNARFPMSWGDFRADQSALQSGRDLSPEFKTEILYVHSQIEELSYYDLLGGEPEDDARSFKKTYIKLSKKFHPDVFYGKDAGDFKALSESIFKSVTKAYQTLSNSKKRAEYNESLQGSLEEVSSGLDPENRRQLVFQTLVRRGYALEETGDFGSAVDEYRRALGVQRDDALLLRCGTLLLHAGMRLDEAATYARAVLETSPKNVEAWLLLGKIYERNDILGSALEAFQRAAECAPGEASLRVHVERLRASMG